jgi:hypothetical protein
LEDRSHDERKQEAVMSNQPMGGMGGMLPGVAAAGGLRQDDDQDQATSDGVPVGEADREADAERSGADTHDDGALADPAGLMSSDDDLGVEKSGSGDGVPVGADDAEADRERTTEG